MLTRLRKSRGYGKFKRNRGAMFALAIIACYALLGLWVWSVENLNAFGKYFDHWDWDDRPVLGLLLPERTLERVGPPLVAGCGMQQDIARRTDQADWMMTFIGDSLALMRDGKPAEPLAERRLADRPLDDLDKAYQQGKTFFNSLDAVKLKKGHLASFLVALQRVKDRTALAASIAPEQLADYRHDLTYGTEDLLEAFDNYTKTAGDDDPIKIAIDTRLVDAVDALWAAESDASLDAQALAALIPLDALDTAHTLAPDRLAAFDAEIEPSLRGIETAVADIVPDPTGFRGLLYDFKMLLGTDRQGRSIMIRSLYSAKIAVQVGTVVAFFSVLIGAVLGAAAAFFGGWVDHAVIWLYSTLSTLPQLVLLAVLTFMFLDSKLQGTLVPLYIAFCLTFWIGPCRIIRGEMLKIRQLEYVQAATAIGFSRPYILLKHALPNTLHLAFINFSLLFIGAIKSEVILTFLGLGVKDGASWGIMISQSRPEVVLGFFWQIGAATVFMLVLVLAFNVVSDALQDAFDPKHVG